MVVCFTYQCLQILYISTLLTVHEYFPIFFDKRIILKGDCFVHIKGAMQF